MSGADYTGHWDEKFRSRAWGRYPPEDLVRFMGRNWRDADKAAEKVASLKDEEGSLACIVDLSQEWHRA